MSTSLVVIIGTEIAGSSELFLTYIDGGSQHGLLEFNPEAAAPSLKAKFVMEKVEDSADNGLVHIRSSYNNKYWTIKDTSEPLKYFIQADADKKVDDTKSAKCTLFRKTQKPNSLVTFTHVRTGYNVHVDSSSKCLCIVKDQTATDFKVTDYDMFVALPKRVIFKGDNGKYLQEYIHSGGFYDGAAVSGGARFRQTENLFAASDPADATAQYEVFQLNNCIKIKCLHNNKFLRVSGDSDPIILADSDDTSSKNRSTLFEVILAENCGRNVIALRSRRNGKICERVDKAWYEYLFTSTKSSNALYASATSTVREALITVEEPLIMRRIHLKYFFNEALIINRSLPRYTSTVEIPNESTQQKTIPHLFKFEARRKSIWKTSTSFSTNVKMEISFDVPEVKGMNFSVSRATETTRTEHITKEDEFSYKDEITKYIDVPARSNAIIKWYVEELTYEVPFSYTQKDIYNDTTEKEYTFKDGVYHGMQGHDIIIAEKTIQPLP